MRQVFRAALAEGSQGVTGGCQYQCISTCSGGEQSCAWPCKAIAGHRSFSRGAYQLCKPASPPSAIAVESPVLLQSDEPIGETSDVVPCHPCVHKPVCDPEFFASQFLLQDTVERRNLCAALPKEDSQTAGAGKFSAGVHQHGGVASMRRTCDLYPNTSRALNLFVSQHVDVSYNALVVIDNLASPMHRDVLNEATPHWITPVGAFSGGGVWQQDATGTEQPVVQGKLTNGSILSLSEPACLRASTCFTKLSLGKEIEWSLLSSP